MKKITEKNISKFPIANIMGIKINLVDYDKTVNLINEIILLRINSKYICACPVHPIMVAQRDKILRDAINSSWLSVPDGKPVVWAIKLLGYSLKNNVRGTELMLRTCKMSQMNDFSIFLLGGRPSTLQNLKHTLLNRFKGLRISGCYSPPFRKLSNYEENKIIEMINTTLPDVLFVGLGAPKQEKWMFKNCKKLYVPVTIGVGAAFDFIAGDKKQAPRWMQSAGLEWLFRLGNEPGRLFFRYFIYNLLFIFLIALNFLKPKHRNSKSA